MMIVVAETNGFSHTIKGSYQADSQNKCLRVLRCYFLDWGFCLMRFARFALPVIAVVFLAGCVSRDDGKIDFWEWMNSRPSKTENTLGYIPTSYAGHNKNRPVLKPPYQEPTWTEIADYQAPEVAPADVAGPVTVYPDQGYDQTSLVAEDNYGNLVQQIFFKHGSSHLVAAEKQSLKALAEGINHNAVGAVDANGVPQGVAVTVVGHASQRVDGVNDPMRRKMINFEMAQKRANAVTQELNKAGLNPAWVQSVSKGDEEPNATTSGRAQEEVDRRVDIFVNGGY